MHAEGIAPKGDRRRGPKRSNFACCGHRGCKRRLLPASRRVVKGRDELLAGPNLARELARWRDLRRRTFSIAINHYRPDVQLPDIATLDAGEAERGNMRPKPRRSYRKLELRRIAQRHLRRRADAGRACVGSPVVVCDRRDDRGDSDPSNEEQDQPGNEVT